MGRPSLQIVDGKKRCSTCKAWKDVSLFYQDQRAKTQLRGRCKECDIEQVNTKVCGSLERALKNLAIRNHSNCRNGSVRRQELSNDGYVTFDVLLALWNEQEGRCAVTGVSMTHVQGQGHRIMTNVTVDRIDNDKGYMEGNIRLVCKAVNLMKSMMTDRELVEWSALVVQGMKGRLHSSYKDLSHVV